MQYLLRNGTLIHELKHANVEYFVNSKLHFMVPMHVQGDHLKVYLKQTLGSDLYRGAPLNIIHRLNAQGGSFNM